MIVEGVRRTYICTNESCCESNKDSEIPPEILRVICKLLSDIITTCYDNTAGLGTPKCADLTK